MTQREILVTHALPYANGPLHIGHLLGYIQSDIWVRARRMAGDTVHFVAADDVHGTPIMLAAEKDGKSPEEFIKGIFDGHVKDFAEFGVKHDYYYTTHSPENQQLAELIYKRLRDAKPSHITTRAVRQFYDPLKQMFLPDRYIKGECPNCGTPDQYGDNCENCGATYAPTDLKNPRSVVSGATPELRDSEHYFFKLGDFTDFLRNWLAGEVAHPSIKAKLKEWLDADGGLRDWDISRDAPYFGFPIPDAPGKFFYVWLDAPIGYLASFKKYCASDEGRAKGLKPESFDQFMQVDNPAFDRNAEMHHFLGKDIINFHGLFWPAMLDGARLRTPTKLHVNGYLTVNGEKMSKSRGTFIQARTYLDAGLNPDYLRYYFATMLGAAPTDIDLDLKAFEERVNSHLVGKWVNIASRCARLLNTYFDNRLAEDFWSDRSIPLVERQPGLGDAHIHIDWTVSRLQKTVRQYVSGEFHKVAADIVSILDKVNEYIATVAPWVVAKDPSRSRELHIILTTGLNLFRAVACAFKPILPATVAAAESFLNLPNGSLDTFEAIDSHLSNHVVKPYSALLTRIDPKHIETMIESSKESLGATPSPANPPLEGEGSKARVASSPQPSALSPASLASISIDDFAKLDLRIGTVLQCGFVEGSDKLLRFELDAGELGKRQIFSGIRASYQEPEKLVGRKVVFIANLAPRKMRFGMSEGMILSAGSDGGLFLLDVDSGAEAGMPVK